MRFFFYGTLLDTDVMALVLGRRLPPAAYTPAILPGHARRRAKGASYPVVVRDAAARVPGAVVGGLSARDVARLSAFEGPGYRIATLRVVLAAGMTTVSVFEPVLEPAAMAATRQARLRWPAEARVQRAPGVFHTLTWIAEQ